jgi:hypothetical protein
MGKVLGIVYRTIATQLSKKARLTHPEMRLYHTPFTDWERRRFLSTFKMQF